MGIYDREYYRREGPSFLGSFTDQGKACKWLIAVNVIAFVLQIVVPQVTGWFDLRLEYRTPRSQSAARNGRGDGWRTLDRGDHGLLSGGAKVVTLMQPFVAWPRSS